jgi:glycosyltransferase involved in cell wall biosynthesis
MKIAMVTEYLAPKEKPHFGGVDARTINLAKQLAKKNDVQIITSLIDGGKRIENYDGVEIHRIGKKRQFTQRGDFSQRLKFNSMIISEISKLQPDIVDGSGFVSYAGCYKGAKKIGVPAIATVHEIWRGTWTQNMGLINGFAGHFLEKHYLKYSFDGYISVSDFTKEKLIDQMKIPEEKIAVIYNGINLDLFKKTFVDEKYPDPTIVTVCRLVSYKRVEDLIKAIKILKSDIPNIRLKIIGNGPQEEYLKTLSKELGIIDRIDFLGKISDTQDMIKILKKSHVFALPSITEGFGMVIIEALAASIPYVSSDIPPIREITNGGIGGFLCKTKNYKDLALKIKSLLTDESKRTNVMKNVSSHIEKFEWSNLALDLETYYIKLCERSMK